MPFSILVLLASIDVSQQIPPHGIADGIVAARNSIINSEQMFECIELHPQRADDQATENQGVPRSAFRVRVTERGDRFRIETLPPVGTPSQEPIRIVTWNGERFMTEEHRDVTIWGTPQAVAPISTPLFCGIAGRAMLLEDLAGAVRDGVVLGQEVNGQTVVHRFRFADQPWQVMAIGLRLGDRPRIESFALRILSEDAANPTNISEWSYKVTKWNEVGDHDLPMEALSDYTGPRRPNDPTLVTTRTIYRRIDTKLLDTPPDSALFEIGIGAGDRVMDQRTRVGWTHGEPTIVVDGTPYGLAEAVTSDPFDRLQQLLATSQKVVPADAGIIEHKDRHFRWTRFVFIAVGSLPLLAWVAAVLARRCARTS